MGELVILAGEDLSTRSHYEVTSCVMVHWRGALLFIEKVLGHDHDRR